MSEAKTAELSLYSYWRSSAAYRVRIALNMKGLPYKLIPVHLVKDGGEHHGEQFRSLNSQGLVPVLVHQGEVITQSMAICEYLDEQFAQYPLLPADPLERARVRSLALQIACDIHPLNNLRVMKYLQKSYAEAVDTAVWMKHWMSEGFSALEIQLENRFENRESANDSGYITAQPGLFECFLIPQVYNAERFGTEMSGFPHIQQIVEKCRALPSFSEAAPENQADAA